MDFFEIVKTASATIGGIATIGGAVFAVWRYTARQITREAFKKMSEADINESPVFRAINEQNRQIGDKIDHLADTVSEINERVKTNELGILRAELIALISTQPEKIDIIEEKFAKYRSAGGNGYMEELFLIWREDFAIPALKTTIRKTNK